MAVYSDAPFEEARKAFYRNGYGATGLEPFHSTHLCDMSEGYLRALLVYDIPAWQRDIVEKEIEYREKNNIVFLESINQIIHE